MAETRRSLTSFKTLRLLLTAVALLAGALVVSAPAASAAPALAPQVAVAQQVNAHQAGDPTVAASWDCNSSFDYWGLERYCDVYSGQIRSYIDCSNGYRYYTRWLGVGRWHIIQDCYPYRRLGSGIQSRY